jgi:hypothetical protein
LIREARLDWNATLSDFPSEHLLFGTRNMREIRVKTYYEADTVAAGDK